MLRIGVTIGIKEDKIEEYKKLHAKVWPEVLENLTELNLKTILLICTIICFLVIWNITAMILKEITN